MNQLIPKVSSVPRVRQLTALRTDLVCVSAPRNEPATRYTPRPTMSEPNTPHPVRVRRMSCAARRNTFAAAARTSLPKMGKSSMNTGGDEAHFAQRNPTNQLIKLRNHDLSETGASLGSFLPLRINWSPKASRKRRGPLNCRVTGRGTSQHSSRHPVQFDSLQWRIGHICSQIGRNWSHNGMRNRQNRPMCDGRWYQDESVFR